MRSGFAGQGDFEGKTGTGGTPKPGQPDRTRQEGCNDDPGWDETRLRQTVKYSHAWLSQESDFKHQFSLVPLAKEPPANRRSERARHPKEEKGEGEISSPWTVPTETRLPRGNRGLENPQGMSCTQPMGVGQ